jgi:hypothetical protein
MGSAEQQRSDRGVAHGTVHLCGFSTTSPKVLFCHVQIINIDLVVV